MPTYDDLSNEDKAVVDAYVNALRARYGSEWAKVCNGFEDLENLWGSGVSTIIAGLDAGSTIPNRSNLNGAQALLKEEVESYTANSQNHNSTYNTLGFRQTRSKAAGPINTG